MNASPFERSRPETCLSDLALDQLVADAGEHPHLFACETCRARFTDIRREHDEHSKVSRPISRRRSRRWAVAVPIALAASLSAVFLRTEDGVRTKGGPEISFYVKHGEGVRRGLDGEVIAPRDSIRFAYTTSVRKHLSILSVDPDRRISVYYPEGDTRPEPPGVDVLLPISTALDDSVGREQIYALFCEGPIDLGEAKRLLASDPTRAPPLDACTSSALSFEKRR